METGYIPPNLNFKKAREGVQGLESGRIKIVTEKEPFFNETGLIGKAS